MSLAQFTGLGLTDEQRAERDIQKENGTLAKDWDRCEKWKKDLIERSESHLSAHQKEARLNDGVRTDPG
jgi:hypothetical protein